MMVLDEGPSEEVEDVDPIADIIDYLVRCTKITFKTAHINEKEFRTSEKIKIAREKYEKSPTDFLLQYGKYLAPQHVNYFDNLQPLESEDEHDKLRKCIDQLKQYHSEESRRKRVRNRRYKALQKLETDSDYFSEKEMMYRNPLLYEQLVGQFLTDDEIRERDGADNDNLTLLSLILDFVDRNQMREIKDEQSISEELASTHLNEDVVPKKPTTVRWGEFDIPEPALEREKWKPEVRKQVMISAPEKRLFREEFYQEMFSSFIDGHDDVDYNSIDNDEQYDDLLQVSQDAEDKYFDSETNETDNLEQHMQLTAEYCQQNTQQTTEYSQQHSRSPPGDTLDVYMDHLNKRSIDCYLLIFILNTTFL